MGYDRININKVNHENILKRKKSICHKYEYYKNETHYLVDTFYPSYIVLSQILISPVYILWNGVKSIPDVLCGLYRLILQKRTGAFVRQRYDIDKDKREEIHKILNSIK